MTDDEREMLAAVREHPFIKQVANGLKGATEITIKPLGGSYVAVTWNPPEEYTIGADKAADGERSETTVEIPGLGLHPGLPGFYGPDGEEIKAAWTPLSEASRAATAFYGMIPIPSPVADTKPLAVMIVCPSCYAKQPLSEAALADHRLTTIGCGCRVSTNELRKRIREAA